MKLRKYKCIQSYSCDGKNYITRGNYYTLDDNSDYIDKYDNGIEGHMFSKSVRELYFKLVVLNINNNVKVL